MAEFNISLSAPLLAYNLYEFANRTEDCEGLIFGSYRRKRRSNVDDVADRTDVTEYELIIKKFLITGVRGTFYDRKYDVDVLKLTQILSVVDERLELLGWFNFGRVVAEQFSVVYNEISRHLNAAKTWSAGMKCKFEFAWGGPLFLNVFERNFTDNIKLDVGETKYQMYYYNGNATSSSTNNLKQLKFKILNVGDTSHVDYASIDVQNSDGFSILSELSASISPNLVDEIEKNVTQLGDQSRKSIADAIQNIAMTEMHLPPTNGINCQAETNVCDGGLEANFNLYRTDEGSQSWEIINAETENRGLKREKGDQSASSSGNNSDELENATGVVPRPMPMSHVTKRSRGLTGDPIDGASTTYVYEKPTKGKGRARTIVP